jgi:hypothetical protein
MEGARACDHSARDVPVVTGASMILVQGHGEAAERHRAACSPLGCGYCSANRGNSLATSGTKRADQPCTFYTFNDEPVRPIWACTCHLRQPYAAQSELSELCIPGAAQALAQQEVSCGHQGCQVLSFPPELSGWLS